MRGFMEWIRQLGPIARHADGTPSAHAQGVPVAGMDVREREYCRVADVREKALANHIPWPIAKPASGVAPTQDASEPPQHFTEPARPASVHEQGKQTAGVLIHTTKRNRTSHLGAAIKEAARRAIDPTDWVSAWDAFVAMAQGNERPPPLLGYAEGEGVKYQTDNGSVQVKFLTRDAFRKRFGRLS